MKEVTIYRSDGGRDFRTQEEAEVDDFEMKAHKRLTAVFPSERDYNAWQIVSRVEALLKALGIPFDRAEFMAKEF